MAFYIAFAFSGDLDRRRPRRTPEGLVDPAVPQRSTSEALANGRELGPKLPGSRGLSGATG